MEKTEKEEVEKLFEEFVEYFLKLIEMDYCIEYKNGRTRNDLKKDIIESIFRKEGIKEMKEFLEKITGIMMCFDKLNKEK